MIALLLSSASRSVVLMCLLVCALLSAPAFALDDGQGSPLETFSGLTDFLGLTQRKEPPEIDYRERPALVLPPSYDALPAPQTASAGKNPAWPNDPDAARRAVPSAAVQGTFVKDADARTSSKQELMAAHNNAIESHDFGSGNCTSSLDKNCWINPDKLKAEHLQRTESTDNIVAGVEPPRLNLTDPPKGYRVATKTTKATQEPAKPKVDDSNPRNFYRTDTDSTN